MTPKENREKVDKDAKKDAKNAPETTSTSPADAPVTTLEPKEQEEAMLNDQVQPYSPDVHPDAVDKKGEHPFNATERKCKLVLKIKLDSDDLFLNPELRNLGYKEGDIMEVNPAKDSHANKNSNK